ncbi:Asp-tRNA(Asn)/Glu-tRNA(Gln) amidotransferase subunit GatB [Candidatus Laterigemmans baculatus]|uniref:Asp-tRNA(Asn)/Glu-tRNA(Gln) amidotransferase subunit GatB n=1 Tax=Candidatus Laterigemmans baculatus TaxID=2770505 RepID=UPI001F160158|nr:Asp-tRNA(Asn)/Glu-tRNA(Gln) amidotransferase subunit GatB [Candidatus Laterigemmans baculatus]
MSRLDTEHQVETIIGLEVHVQLRTQTKLFCRCSTEFGAPPNTQTCPVCLGLPGALPVINEHAIELAIRTGLALNCEIPPLTKWDRKQYFYPDLPKGYQISQFDLPICADGFLEITDPADDTHTRRIPLVRAHLEEDAGKSMHDEAAGISDTRIDLNRCGTPLLEIVTQPAMRSAAEARAFLSELKLLLTHLGVSDCEMQEGSLRVDANVNLHIEADGKEIATPIVEIKNMNSFRAVERAIEYEVRRQYIDWEDTGETIEDRAKQTRGWDDAAEATFAQREKEESADYRYFPDPDLLPVRLPRERIEAAQATLGELPAATRQRLQSQYDIKAYDADVIVNQGPAMIAYFETTAETAGDGRRASAWMQQDVMRSLKESDWEIGTFPIPAIDLGRLLRKVDAGELDNARARDVFQYMLENDTDAEGAIEALGIVAVDAGEIEALCRELLEANPKVVEQVRGGKEQAIGALIGQAKKKNPNANPQQVKETCLRMIREG